MKFYAERESSRDIRHFGVSVEGPEWHSYGNTVKARVLDRISQGVADAWIKEHAEEIQGRISLGDITTELIISKIRETLERRL